MADSTNNIYCSHDKLFKEILSDLEHARSFIENYLPADLLNYLDLNSLEICKDSFVEKELEEFHSDLLYKVKSENGPAYVYLLFEHKSYPYSLIHLQLLKYMIGIWQLNIKQSRSKQLDIIVPLVLYHGKEQWHIPLDFGELFTDRSDVVQPYIPDFQYQLFDLHQYSDDQIRGTVVSRLVMLMFKYVFDPGFEHKIPKLLALFEELASRQTGLQYIESLIRYMLSNVENLTGDKLKTMIANLITGKEGSVIMEFAESAAGKIFHEGMQQGMQQGIQQGLIQGIKEMTFDLIEIKFGRTPDTHHAQQLVKDINDIEKLKALREKIKAGASISDLTAFLHQS